MLKWGVARGARDGEKPRTDGWAQARGRVQGVILGYCDSSQDKGVRAEGLRQQRCAPLLPPTSLLSPSGDCVPSPCHNGGTCLEEEEGVRCLCLPGYGGHLCDVGECVEGWEGQGRG